MASRLHVIWVPTGRVVTFMHQDDICGQFRIPKFLECIAMCLIGYTTYTYFRVTVLSSMTMKLPAA